MMRVIVESDSPDSNTVSQLLPGDSISIGSSTAADALIRDPYASSQHIRITVGINRCTVTDLNSQNGTFLNGVQIGESLLNSDDVIQFGKTTCIIRIEDESQSFVVRSPFREYNQAFACPPSKLEFTYSEVLKHQSLIGYAGRIENGEGWEVIRPLISRCPMYVLCNLHLAGIQLEPEVERKRNLLNSLKEPMPSPANLFLFNEFEPQEQRQALEYCWQRDAAVCLFTHQPQKKLEDLIKSSAGFWLQPAKISGFLTGAALDVFQKVLQSFFAVAVSTQDGWLVVGPKRQIRPWVEFGFPAPPHDVSSQSEFIDNGDEIEKAISNHPEEIESLNQ